MVTSKNANVKRNHRQKTTYTGAKARKNGSTRIFTEQETNAFATSHSGQLTDTTRAVDSQ
jgi:hypothetical protein